MEHQKLWIRLRRITVQTHLKVSLLESQLAHSRSAKILQWFKDDRQEKMRAHSGPCTEPSLSCHGSEGGAGDADEGAKACGNAVDRIVKPSLDRNMKFIMRRAMTSMDMPDESYQAAPRACLAKRYAKHNAHYYLFFFVLVKIYKSFSS
jgi:hypothetical protein